jgi:predicted RecA/RadA family phage recombinase
MKNFIAPGVRVTVAAPYALTSGDGCLVGSLFGVATGTALITANTEILTEGVCDIKKDTSTFADGDPVYWDNSAKKATSTSASNKLIGVAVLLQPDGTSALGGSSGNATVRVRLNEAFGVVGTDSAGAVVATVALAAADIIAMNGAPVSILAAPGAGKVIIVDSILFEMTRTSTAFTGGGALNFQYHTTTTSVPHAGTIAATLVTTGGAGTAQTALGPNVGTNGLVIPANEGIDITNASAGFAAGTGTAKVFIKYRTITL